VLHAILPPLIAAYLVFIAMVVVALRRPVPSRGLAPETSVSPRPSIVTTVVGGYATFIAIVLVFHVWLAGERDALWSAVWGGGFLSLLTLALAAGGTLVLRRRTGKG
jgi:hypothetical protein